MAREGADEIGGEEDPHPARVAQQVRDPELQADEDTRGLKVLHNLNLDHLLHSTVDVRRPTFIYYKHEEIQLEFLRAAMKGSTDGAPKTLLIGGGGYTLPRAAMKLVPGTRMDVVEIDPEVTKVAYEALGLKKHEHHRDVNMDGRLQGAARAINPPGEAQEDWQVFVNVGMALGVPMTYTSSAAIRAELAGALAGNERYAGLTDLAFARPVPARHWLQASNPSERWKWDFMFQDLPPVKFAGTPAATSLTSGLPLREIK